MAISRCSKARRRILFGCVVKPPADVEHAGNLSAVAAVQDPDKNSTGTPVAPIVALLDFPRIEDRRRALAAGAQAILSKPLQVDDLFWELDRRKKGTSLIFGRENEDNQ